jgi:hypothetical protein
VAEDDRRTVAGNLDYVLGGVGTRSGEVCDDDLVDGAAIVVEKFAEGGRPGAEIAFQGDEGGGNAGGIGAGQAYDANGAAAGWS